ncbi:hypothetical protein ACQ4M4_18040 [Leptolyngbya sp. AN02str]|uniref:hypothetical protein n=1 Tax=Leptolyngbya sp. AN02str TaxID=3423363 RepID=UPI003D3163A7
MNMFGALILLGAVAGISTAVEDAMNRSAFPRSAPLPDLAAALPAAIGGGGAEPYVTSDIENHVPISRAELEQLLAAGGGLDGEGNFNQPIPLTWGYTPTAPIVRMPFAWAPDEAALITVQDGAFVAIDFETGAW